MHKKENILPIKHGWQGDGEAAPSALGNKTGSEMHFPIFLISTRIQHPGITGLPGKQPYFPFSCNNKHGDGYNIFRGNNDSAFPLSTLQ